MDVTTVADDLVVLHEGTTAHVYEDLRPDSDYELEGHPVHTLRRPEGQLLSRFATVNDVHFGEIDCGRIDDDPRGPILRVADGEPPYPETMNRAAADEIAKAGVAAVIVKGDLTADGQPDEFAAFESCWAERFGDQLHVVRGNHDAYLGQERYAGDTVVDLPGVRITVLDTVIPLATTGQITAGQLEWLGDVAAEADRPVVVLGHHQNWAPGTTRSVDYFGINPDDSERLVALIAHQPRIVAYAAGHTHRSRVRHVPLTGTVPYIEVACVKDFPGAWAEYRVYEGGILQVFHRISSPEALSWSERCRTLYREFGVDYVAYAFSRLEDRCFTIPLRP
jgi:3',5'-cyclic-AMP phosphodiesterase